MRSILIAVFSAIFLAMVGGVFWAMNQRGMTEAGSELMSDRWFQVTLLDAYCGFLTFYVWVWYKEASTASRVVWFVVIMTLGNIAMSAYVLLQLARLPRGAGWEELLLRSEPSQS